MPEIGYIRLYRKLLDNPVVCKDADHIAVWIYLLLNATWKSLDMMFEGSKITLNPGQLITGRKAISSKIAVDEYKVQRILKLFESEQLITQQTTPRNRLVSVLNWKAYQPDAQQDEQQLHNNCTTTAQQLHTNNKDNKDNNVNNNISIVQNGQETADKPARKKKKNEQDLTQEEQQVFDEVWSRLPRQDGLGKVGTAARKNVSVVGKEKMLYAVDQYIKKIKKLQTESKYVMMGSTFINSGYLDYIKGFVPEKTELELLAESQREEASAKIDFTKLILGEGGNGFDGTGEQKR